MNPETVDLTITPEPTEIDVPITPLSLESDPAPIVDPETIDVINITVTLKQITIVAQNVGGIKGDKGDAGDPGPPGPAVTVVSNEIPSGVKNSVNTKFTTALPFLSGSTKLFINGLRQILNIHYTESDIKEITIPDGVYNSDILTIDYIST
jgi:hypothetical protein